MRILKVGSTDTRASRAVNGYSEECVMGKVIGFKCITTLKSDPDRVLSDAIGKLDTALVMGYEKDGTVFFSSSDPDGGNCLWLMESLKKRLLEVCE